MKISRYRWHMKNGIKNFCEKHSRSIIILKIVNGPLRVWKKNQSITMFRCYFRINKGHDHILLVDDKVTEATWKDILCYPKRGSAMRALFKIIFKSFLFCKISWPLTLDVPHTKTLCFGLWETCYLDWGTYTMLSWKLHLDSFHLQTSPQLFLLCHQIKKHEKISEWVFSTCP